MYCFCDSICICSDLHICNSACVFCLHMRVCVCMNESSHSVVMRSSLKDQRHWHRPACHQTGQHQCHIH
uniref:Uncharacterized protein n=1 Tax=Anguilla anguilla TaxID=7936 RepID=A0A0E9XYF8_ANGAN